ncbi:hypothetical protein HY441_00255 [Candidatus Microgenomates bacterium]|nr:hypothetical protein [Candidatus Microgenomates bacterium]
MAKKQPTPAPTTQTSAPSPAAPKSNATKIVIIIVSIIVGLMVIGIILMAVFLGWIGKKAGDITKEATEFVEQIQKYPAAYTNADLPEYPGGEVTYLGNQEASVKDGIAILVTTSDSLSKVSTWYDTELKKQGWQAKGPSSGDDSFFTKTYTKGNQEYALTITSDDETNQTNVTINWSETQ